MKNIKSKILLIIFACLFIDLSAVNIIPQPSSLVRGDSCVVFKEKLLFYSTNPCFKDEIKEYSKILSDISHGDGMTSFPEIKYSKAKSKAHVIVSLDEKFQKEEYKIDVSVGNKIYITAGSDTAFWWALQTFTQIIFEGLHGDEICIPEICIQDMPRYAYRGAMLDCSRHFFSVDEIKRFIDILSLHKLNIFHWHMTDDQGWRIEIKKYPELTNTGSKRKSTLVGHLRRSTEYDNVEYSGYYTQDQVKEIVKYAFKRHITIIPEIEMPGHSQAALASYPFLACSDSTYVVKTEWGISNQILCSGKKTTYKFLEDVLDEVCELFPGEYIHIGGDEVPMDRWEKCRDCNSLLDSLGYKDYKYLQSYMISKIEKYLSGKGKKIIGWDEILEGHISKDAVVMSWRGAKGGIKAAKMGNKVVMSPNSHLYFDYYQTKNPEKNGEPLSIGGYISLEKCYMYNPEKGLLPEHFNNIMGIQANVWTEYIKTFEQVMIMSLPRLAAASEVAWTSSKVDYRDFTTKLTKLLELYRINKFKYAEYAIE